jgi:hypothetical protein
MQFARNEDFLRERLLESTEAWRPFQKNQNNNTRSAPGDDSRCGALLLPGAVSVCGGASA